MIATCVVAFAIAGVNLPAQKTVTTFEMRHFTVDPKADGVTDFHGPAEWLDTEGRVADLNAYAAFASRFWGDPGMDKPLFADEDVHRKLSGIKPQPLSSVRRTVRLEQWRAYGWKEGKKEKVSARWKEWCSDGGEIKDGCLVLGSGEKASVDIEPLKWRFRLYARTGGTPTPLHLILVPDSSGIIDIGIDALDSFEVYGDLEEGVIFLSHEGRTLREFPVEPGAAVKGFSLVAGKDGARIDGIRLYRFDDHRADSPTTPYRTVMAFDEDFEEVPSMEGWQSDGYDDSEWETVTLPSPHGGLAEEGEGWYLRTKVKVGSFTMATLNLEALDPGGEVWINGEPVAVLKGRVPWSLDVTEYVKPDSENTIAVKVKPFHSDVTVFHCPSDHNIGWFLGRTELLLMESRSHITEALVHTLSLDDGKAVQHHKVSVRNESNWPWKGSLTVNYYPWFPSDGPLAGGVERELELRPGVDNVVSLDIPLENPELWSTSDPRLYKVEFVLKDSEGKPVDDFVTTTGVRLIEQKEGVLYVNHKPEILGGAQIFGYRLPLETVSKTIRCATPEQAMGELMMIKSLGNLLRIHVHAENVAPNGIGDPRFAEWADQMGIYLIWQTPSWIREGEVWNIDIKNYPLHMRQVFNHPSIVMWEAGNHPNQFKKHPFNDSEDFINAIVPAIALTDSSRLISPVSYWPLMHFANYDGTLDSDGNTHPANPWLMHRMMTRGSQDSYTGYTNNWSRLRESPYPWAKSCLEAKDLCYFNFEHEESIAQPNWELARKDPWYKVQSYEKEYDTGSIGRPLRDDEWREGQAYQAFAAWESMKKQTLDGVSGFSWCSLESGPNMFTYQKPIVDPYRVPKLAFHANRMTFNRIWAGSDDVDTVYGPGDTITPVIFNLDDAVRANLTVELQNEKGKVLERKRIKGVEVPAGRSVTRLEPFRFRNGTDGCRFVVYRLEIQ